MFLYPSWTRAGTYLFIAGSFFFALRPTIKVTRELMFLRLDRHDENQDEGDTGENP